MSLKSFSNKVKRNGFDLSFKNAFTAKAGELLPVFCKEVIPGDKWRINGQAFTRTQPLMSSAFVRMREYYDFFFVPYKLLWNRAPAFFTNLPDYHQASDVNNPVQVGDRHPYFTNGDMLSYAIAISSAEGHQNNFFGYNRYSGTVKLMNYLDYTDITGSFGGSSGSDNVVLNPFPLLSYQKICQDYFRDDQWEQAAPWRYNLDYITSLSDLHIPVSTMNLANYTMFDLNYCNYAKDYFMGMLPSPQYGDEVFAPLSGNVELSGLMAQMHSPAATQGTSYNVTAVNMSSNPSASLQVRPLLNNGSPQTNSIDYLFGNLTTRSGAGLSILALRQAEAMQKWREISQSGRQDYQTQMQKHFGVNPSDAMSNHCKYLGGWTSNLDISDVVNSNFAVSDATLSQADIKGKGTFSSRGNVDFESKEHGIIMGIYHCMPLLDYSNNGFSKLNMKSTFTDYAIPEFDSVGMEQLNGKELATVLVGDDGSTVIDPQLGYVPRYADYKTSIDRVHGEFSDSLKYWVASLTPDYLTEYFQRMYDLYGSYKVDYTFFKVNPSILDNLFGVAVDSTLATDQFLVNSFFDTKVVRNLDYNGLPY